MLKDEYKKLINSLSPNYYIYEQQTKEFIMPYIEKMDGTFIDCGAHSGIYTVLFSLCASKVICFEPTGNIVRLKKNLEVLKPHLSDNIVIESMAVGNKTGVFTDGLWERWKAKKVEGEFQFTTLDNYVKNNDVGRIDFIKIDVDSFDFEVLQGSVEVMKEFSPMVLVELNPALKLRGHSREEACEFMKEAGYKLIGEGEYGNTIWEKDGKV
ncbi:MAG TPA: FkbM family methyltransferase [Candidatus Thermoplasmatota archaeon]|nr:FkbM family methyltransferase [Candidatus Thermoplasmatota archaeon]